MYDVMQQVLGSEYWAISVSINCFP